MEGIEDAEGMLQGQAQIWKYMVSMADSMALKCAVELRIADIIQSHGHPVTLSQILSGINNASPSTDITSLARIMRMLVHNNIFTAANHPQSSDGQEEITLYGLTHSSRWLLHDAELSLAPLLLMEYHPWLLAPWHHLSGCVRQGGSAFEKAHGRHIWDFASTNPEFNRMFNDGMRCTTQIILKAVISGYKDGFHSTGSLVDVGGGTGAAIAEIVKAYPHIKGINFDLPHVVETAPEYQGVSHVGGDMFKAVPTADAVFMKWIMHDWNDQDCVKILKNCRKAIPEKSGKVIIVEVVLDAEGEGLFDHTRLSFDLLMMAYCSGGKERNEVEWTKLLQQGGFMTINIIKIPALVSIIEAYPQ